MLWSFLAQQTEALIDGDLAAEDWERQRRSRSLLPLHSASVSSNWARTGGGGRRRRKRRGRKTYVDLCTIEAILVNHPVNHKGDKVSRHKQIYPVTI